MIDARISITYWLFKSKSRFLYFDIRLKSGFDFEKNIRNRE